MLWFYKEKRLLISLILIILDGIIIYYIPSFMNKLNYFYPMLTISFIPFLYKEKTRYLIVLGIVFDLLYSNIFLYNVVIFLLLASIDYKIIKYFNNSLVLYIFLSLLNITLYDSILFLLVIVSNYQSITIHDLIYKISHSIILNIMSVFVFYFMFKKRSLNA